METQQVGFGQGTYNQRNSVENLKTLFTFWCHWVNLLEILKYSSSKYLYPPQGFRNEILQLQAELPWL